MRQIIVSQRFRKKLKDFLRKHPEVGTTVETKLRILQQDAHGRRLRAHKLSGNLKNFFAISITYEYRLIFSINENSIILHAIGGHDEVY